MQKESKVIICVKISKSHGTHNSFVIIYDNLHHELIKSKIQKICHQFNTDGLLIVSDHIKYDYKMDYFNNDGTWETMCANGARCVALFMWNNKKCKELVINKIDQMIPIYLDHLFDCDFLLLIYSLNDCWKEKEHILTKCCAKYIFDQC